MEIGAHPWRIFETQSLGVELGHITPWIANAGVVGKVVFHSVKYDFDQSVKLTLANVAIRSCDNLTGAIRRRLPVQRSYQFESVSRFQIVRAVSETLLFHLQQQRQRLRSES